MKSFGLISFFYQCGNDEVETSGKIICVGVAHPKGMISMAGGSKEPRTKNQVQNG